MLSVIKLYHGLINEFENTFKGYLIIFCKGNNRLKMLIYNKLEKALFCVYTHKYCPH